MDEQKNIIDEGKELLAQLTEQNKKMEENLQRAERLHVEGMLGGTSSAGQVPAAPPEETPQAYAARVMQGKI